MAEQLRHEGLAKAHHLEIALAAHVEVAAALAAAHRQPGERVLERLLEAEKLEDPQGDGGVEAQAALVGADGAVQLHAEALVDLDLTLVVDPGDPEHDGALGLDDALEDLGLSVGRRRLDNRHDGLDDLPDGLVELGLRRVLGDELRHE